jgi:hypothetical protein
VRPTTSSANSRMLNSLGLPRLIGPVTSSADHMDRMRPSTRSLTEQSERFGFSSPQTVMGSFFKPRAITLGYHAPHSAPLPFSAGHLGRWILIPRSPNGAVRVRQVGRGGFLPLKNTEVFCNAVPSGH